MVGHVTRAACEITLLYYKFSEWVFVGFRSRRNAAFEVPRSQKVITSRISRGLPANGGNEMAENYLLFWTFSCKNMRAHPRDVMFIPAFHARPACMIIAIMTFVAVRSNNPANWTIDQRRGIEASRKHALTRERS